MFISRHSVSSLVIIAALVGPSMGYAGKRELQPPSIPAPSELNKGISLSDLIYAPNDSEQYFQTWNLYLATDDDHHVFVNFVISNLGIGDNACGLNVAMNDPARKSHLETIQLSGEHFEGKTDVLDVRCADITVRGDTKTLHIKGELKTLGVDITLHRTGPGIATGTMYLDEDHEEYMLYNVPFINARAEGRIKIGGKWRPANGKGLIEHVNQNVGLHEYSRLWTRIRVLTDTTTIILGGFEPSDDFARGFTMLALVKDGRVLHIADEVTLKTGQFKEHPNSGYELPQTFEIAVDDGRLKLNGTVKTTRLIGEFDVLSQVNWFLRFILKTFVANPWVFRNEVDATITYSLAGGESTTLKSRGINEVIFIND